MGTVTELFPGHARASSAKRKKSFAVTAPPVTAEIRSATSREGQPLPSQSCVTRPAVTPIKEANSLRLIERNERYSASFMGKGFSSTKTLPQGEILAPLHGHDVLSHPKFSMPKKLKKQAHKPEPPHKSHELRPTFIKHWRKKKGWSQTKLGDEIGLSTATISQIENGNTGYTQANLETIACALGCQVVDLLIRDPNDPEGIWALWESAGNEQRQQMVRMFAAFLRSEVA